MVLRLFSILTESEEFKCPMSIEEMYNLLKCGKITCFDNFKYKFEIIKGKYRLGERKTKKKGK